MRGGLVAVLLLTGLGGIAMWQSGVFEPAGTAGGDPLDARSPDEIAAWRASYSDAFLSDSQNLFLTGEANVRDYPSSTGTAVLRKLAEGVEITGRLVAGRQTDQKWFKLDGGGYIWDGNIGFRGSIYPAGMGGLFVGRPYSTFVGQLSEQGTYGESPEYCETYNSLDGWLSVMSEQNEATSFLTSNPQLVTQKGISVGMDLDALRQAYGDALVSEPNT